MITSSIDTVLQSSSFVNKILFHGQKNAVSVTVDMQKSDYLDVIKSICLGWLKCMGTDSSMLFSMPRLCSPKKSLNVGQLFQSINKEGWSPF